MERDNRKCEVFIREVNVHLTHALMTKTLFLLSTVSIMACSDTAREKQESPKQTQGSIERLDPALDEIVKSDAKIEIISEGYDWSEGPLWVEEHNMLLFSDI